MHLVNLFLTAVTMLSTVYDNDNNRCCWAQPVQVFQRNLTSLQLLQHVLRYESKWQHILKEKLRTRSLGPLDPGHVIDPLLPAETIADDNALFSVREIVVGVVYKYNKLRTMVNYGSRALYMSLKCNAVRHVAFQAKYVSRLIDMNVEPFLIAAEVSSIKQVVVSFIDKLAMSTHNLSHIFQMYWHLLALMHNESVLRIRDAEYPADSNTDIDELHEKLVQFLNDNCAPYETTLAYFKTIGINVPDKLMSDDVLNVTVPQETLMNVGREHLSYVSRMYKDLGIQTLPYEQWSQLFYSGRKELPADELDKTNVPIIRLPPIYQVRSYQ